MNCSVFRLDWIYSPVFGAYIRIFVEKHRISDATVAGGAGRISDELYEAAEVDGAGWLQSFYTSRFPR